MTHFLYVYETDMPTVSMIRKDAKLFYGENARFKSLREIRPEDIEWADNVFFIRPNNVFSWLLAGKARKAGCFVTAFCDDDLLNLPKDIPSIPWRKRFLKKILGEADLFQSSNAYICEKYAPYSRTGRTYATETPIYDEDLARIPRREISNEGAIKLVYAAGRDHAGIFHEFIAPILPELEKRYGERFSLTTVGVDPDLSAFRGYRMKLEHVDGMPLEKYRNYMRSQCFDIGLAPLHDSNFNKCKYYNKFLEYTLVGTTGIFSDCEPYTLIVKDRENGLLAENTPEGWYRAICEAVDDSSLRKSCLDSAVRLLETRFSSEAHLRLLKENVPELFRGKENSGKCGTLVFERILYGLYRVADIAYLSGFYLKRQGIGGYIRKVREHSKLVRTFNT